MPLRIPSDHNFLYQVESGIDLLDWSTEGMPAAVAGTGEIMLLEPPATRFPKQFYSIRKGPNFTSNTS